VVIQCRGRHVSTALDVHAHAARGEGSCFLLCLQDAIQCAEADLPFQARMRTHPGLQGLFRERWNVLVAVAADSEGDGSE
jgi:hypothetical protein